jgi:hypothetical protein
MLAGGERLRMNKKKIRLWVVGPFLAYFLIFPTLVSSLAALTTLFSDSAVRHSLRSHDRDSRATIHSR